MIDKPYEFPGCIHVLSAALHSMAIDPADMTISLPREEWWKLQCALERQFRGLMSYDGRAPVLSDEFRYMGVRFKVAPER